MKAAIDRLAARADAYVYWTNNDTNAIGRANLDGTNPDQSFITGATHPLGVAVDASHVPPVASRRAF